MLLTAALPCVCVCVAEAEELLKTWGRNELEEKNVPSWLIFLQQLYAPMPIMIWVAIIIEAAILNFIDMGRYISHCTANNIKQSTCQAFT